MPPLGREFQDVGAEDVGVERGGKTGTGGTSHVTRAHVEKCQLHYGLGRGRVTGKCAKGVYNGGRTDRAEVLDKTGEQQEGSRGEMRCGTLVMGKVDHHVEKRGGEGKERWTPGSVDIMQRSGKVRDNVSKDRGVRNVKGREQGVDGEVGGEYSTREGRYTTSFRVVKESSSIQADGGAHRALTERQAEGRVNGRLKLNPQVVRLNVSKEQRG